MKEPDNVLYDPPLPPYAYPLMPWEHIFPLSKLKRKDVWSEVEPALESLENLAGMIEQTASNRFMDIGLATRDTAVDTRVALGDNGQLGDISYPILITQRNSRIGQLHINPTVLSEAAYEQVHLAAKIHASREPHVREFSLPVVTGPVIGRICGGFALDIDHSINPLVMGERYEFPVHRAQRYEHPGILPRFLWHSSVQHPQAERIDMSVSLSGNRDKDPGVSVRVRRTEHDHTYSDLLIQTTEGYDLEYVFSADGGDGLLLARAYADGAEVIGWGTDQAIWATSRAMKKQGMSLNSWAVPSAVAVCDLVWRTHQVFTGHL